MSREVEIPSTLGSLAGLLVGVALLGTSISWKEILRIFDIRTVIHYNEHTVVKHVTKIEELIDLLEPALKNLELMGRAFTVNVNRLFWIRAESPDLVITIDDYNIYLSNRKISFIRHTIDLEDLYVRKNTISFTFREPRETITIDTATGEIAHSYRKYY
jgi:hypothetical protein